METCCVEHCCNEEQQKEGTSAVDTPSVEEFARAVSAEGSTAMETPSVEEFVNEKVKEEESTAVKTSSMEECVIKVIQVEVISSVETPLWRNLVMNRKMVKKNSQKELTMRIISFRKRNLKTLRFKLHPAYLLRHCQFLCVMS